MKQRFRGPALLAVFVPALLLGSQKLFDRAEPADNVAGTAAPERLATAHSGTARANPEFNSLAFMAGPSGPIVSEAVAYGVSLPLDSLPPAYLTMPFERRKKPEHGPLRLPRPVDPNFVDPVWQQAFNPLSAAMPGPMANFEGQTSDDGGGFLPPDITGAVGKTQYVQLVNGTSMSVYNKNGTRVDQPKKLSALFNTLPATSPCRTDDGDPIVMYDQLADRWLLSQFAVPGGAAGYHECIAISKTNDASKEYYVYDFLIGGANRFHDYPHFGVWPDGYYMSTHEFNPNTYVGAGVFAFERDKMLLGQNARVVFFDLAGVDSRFGGHLPASLDGMTLPPAGAPNYFVEVDDNAEIPGPGGADAMRIWKFHVDWTNPENSTFGLNGQPNFTVPVADFSRSLCTLGVTQAVCVPQPGSEVQLDVLGDRLMFRLAYRNFGTHEALVANHSVVANGNTNQHGIRWYEVRNPGNAPTIFQQGTLAPAGTTDPLHRWMGSIAQDKDGNIAIGYSTSSNSDFPSIAYSGRLVSDPPNTLGQTETVMQAGGASQNPFLYVTTRGGRWGDYTHLSIDPVDDETFWYTNEYYPTPVDAFTVWHTRIGSFKFGPVTAILPPVLSLGADYANPDPDGSYTLNWTRPPNAVGPDLLQSSTSCAPFLTDDCSSLNPWTAASDDLFAPIWTTSATKPQHTGNSTFWAQPQSEAGFGNATLTYDAPISIPATGATTLKFKEFYMNEPAGGCAPPPYPGDKGLVEISTNGGSTWATVYTTQRAAAGSTAYNDEDLAETSVDLTAFAGQSIRLRFTYSQDGCDFFAYVQYGWYVDDISLTNDNWGNLLVTSDTSHTRAQQPNGTQCYRVRTSYLVNGQQTPSEFSNIVTANVASTNLAPVVDSFAASNASGFGPLDVDFTATAHDTDGTVASYTFSFGDGSPDVTQAGATVSHTYDTIGTFTATLKVTDSSGRDSATVSTTIEVVDRVPVAVMSATPTTGDSPLTVSFDASGSHDDDAGDSIVSYSFDFGDGDSPVTQAGATTNHAYRTRGTYDATLTVTDTHGMASAPVTVQIVVTAGPPVAQLSISPGAPAKGDAVTLDGAFSSANDVAEYTFDPGDGSGAVSVLPPATSTSHVYRLSGTYTVSLSVRDTQDVVNATTATITISNTAPVADLTADPTEGQPPLTVSFDASGSFDPDAAKLPGEDFVESYEFDYGDGVVETVSVPAVNHTYSAPGTYEARLTVYDHEGKKSGNVAVWPGINVISGPPKAVLSADQTSGFAPLTVVLDGSGSFDTDSGDSVVSYTFDFDDGSEPLTRYGASSVQHTFVNPGDYEVTLVVRDQSGLDSAPATLAIQVGPVNRAPIARVTADKVAGNAPLTVAFDASTSTDTDGDAIVEYTFDFGDGSAPLSKAQPTATHTYTAPGRYDGSVRVRDARGALSSNTDAVAITANAPLSNGENTTAPPIEDSKGPFSGAMSPAPLLALGLLTLLRRRRRS